MKPEENQADRIETIIKDGVAEIVKKTPSWWLIAAIFAVFTLGVSAILIRGCAAYVDLSAERIGARFEKRIEELKAEVRDLKRIIAMQREDPKAFKRVDDQFKAIEEYERKRNAVND